jgi:hypothetical protein
VTITGSVQIPQEFLPANALWLDITIEKQRSINMSKSSYFLEYMKIYLISLNQDLEDNYNVQSKINIQGQIMATEHLLSVATDIMNKSNEMVYHE